MKEKDRTSLERKVDLVTMYSLTVSLYIVIITAKNWRTVLRDLIFIWDYFTFIWQHKVYFLLEIDQFVTGATPVTGATRGKVHCHSKLSSFWFLCERSAQPVINRKKSFSSLVRINISCLNIEIIKIMLTLRVGEGKLSLEWRYHQKDIQHPEPSQAGTLQYSGTDVMFPVPGLVHL